MTDTEIIKALECCSKYEKAEDCILCPLKRECDCNVIERYALDLINRQKAEIKKLDGQVTHLISYVKTLKTEKDNLIRTYAECQAEAVKEFAERLKKEIDIRTTLSKEQDENVLFLIDNLLKEMGGDAK